MAGLLAWAADVVGGGVEDDQEGEVVPAILTPEQGKYLQELNEKADVLTHSIRDLRMRIPPSDISRRLPHLHAQSVASNAALALHLNAHSATKEQAQLREIKLQEENSAYEIAISDCKAKINEKSNEAALLQCKLKELGSTENSLKAELKAIQAELSVNGGVSRAVMEAHSEKEPTQDTSMHLEEKKEELREMETLVQELEKTLLKVEDNASRQPSAAEMEKLLDRQLHTIIEQLEVKQMQAKCLATEINGKEMELEALNASLSRTAPGGVSVKKNPLRGITHFHGRDESSQRLRFLRSSFVLYILVLNLVVFIKISF